MGQNISPRAAFTASDLAVLNTIYPRGRRYRGPICDVFAVSRQGAGLPWLIVSRQRDGFYVSIDPKEGTRIARRSLSDLVWTQCRRWEVSQPNPAKLNVTR
jgi:hypothetical protein